MKYFRDREVVLMRKIRKKLFPMNRSIKNQTLSEYRRINNISVAIFLVTIQIIYVFGDGMLQNIPSDWFTTSKFRDIILGLFISVTTFSVIYFFVLVIWQNVWKIYHLDTCYISGKWCHVFDRKIDDGKDYVRAGWLTISQNFYDIKLTAHNYCIYFKNGKLVYDSKNVSQWRFALSELENTGDIFACFKKETGYADPVSDSGIMKLSVYNCDKDNVVEKMEGVFMDAGGSKVKGNIKLYRAPKDFKFMEKNPEEWEKYVIDELKRKGANKK